RRRRVLLRVRPEVGPVPREEAPGRAGRGLKTGHPAAQAREASPRPREGFRIASGGTGLGQAAHAVLTAFVEQGARLQEEFGSAGAHVLTWTEHGVRDWLGCNSGSPPLLRVRRPPILCCVKQL